MAFSSLDQLLQKVSDGNFKRIDWQKNLHGAAAQSLAYFPASATGTPAAATIYQAGTNLAFQPTTNAEGSGSIVIPSVAPSNLYLSAAQIYSLYSGSGPAVVYLIDLIGFIRVTSLTSTSLQTIDNTLPPTRYADGKGLRAFIWNDKAAALGSAATVTINYTNSDNVASRVTSALTNNSAPQGQIIHSGTNTTVKPTPFLNLQGADQGIKKIDSIQLSSTLGSSEMCIALCKPIVMLPIIQQGILTERDFITGLPSLPKIEPEANLQIIYAAGAAPSSVAINGSFDFIWD